MSASSSSSPRVGFVMLAHARLDRAGAVARSLAGQGAPVVVHLDPRHGGAAGQEAQDLQEGLRTPGVTVISRHAADWGRFGLVAATLAGLDRLLTDHPDLDHVCLLSGACLPLRPVSDLAGYLAAHPGRDFIESVPVAQHQWVEDGLSLERFTLYHPFSHRHSPWWFSRSVDVQRLLRVRRRLPTGLAPHLGAQWWCLSAATLRAILDHPEQARWQRFFKASWIPDESFFQTLVRAVRPAAEPGPPVHLGRFNRRGRPIVFHDDHADYLAASDHFFARKIDPDADGLYARFLSPDLPSRGAAFAGAVDEGPVDHARWQVDHEGAGMQAAGRFPKGTTITRCDTARPYLAVLGEDEALLEVLWPRLQAAAPGHVIHGRLFREDSPSAFACGSITCKGNLSGQPFLRDYRAAQFLSRLVWADRDRAMVFLVGPGDTRDIRYQLATDPHARLLVLGGAGASDARLAELARPFGGRGKPMPQRAWHRAIDPAPLRADLDNRGDNSAWQALADIVRSDWYAPDGWSRPP